MLSPAAMSSKVENLELVWSSTTLGTFKECARKYQLAILEGWSSRLENIDINFGLIYHAALESFQRSKALGQDYNVALRLAVKLAMERSAHVLLANPAEAGSYKSRYNLIRTIVWHCEHFKEDAVKQLILSNGDPAVELSFVIEAGMDSMSNEPYQLSGHLDRLVIFNDAVYWHDYKTTKTTLSPQYYDGFSPDNQASIYSFASKVAYTVPTLAGIIDAAQIGVNFSRFGRGVVNRTQSQLDEWHRDTLYWLNLAETYALQGYWPMNDKACFRCQFRGICSKDPAVRKGFLESSFGRSTYDPLEVRK